MKFRIFTAVALLSIFLARTVSFGQAPFAHAQNSLSNKNIQCMTEDSRGFVWIGTGRGLYRFNGEFYSSWPDDDNNGIGSEMINCLMLETDEKLWVGTADGIELLQDMKSEDFGASYIGRVYDIRNWSDTELLLSKWGGLYIMDKETGELSPVLLDESLQYYHLYLHDDGTSWIIRSISSQITVLDRNFKPARTITFEGNGVNYISESSDGTIYVCTNEGPRRFSTLGDEVAIPGNLGFTKGLAVLFHIADEKTGRTFTGIRDKGIWVCEGFSGTPHRISDNELLHEVRNCTVIVKNNALLLSKDHIGLEILPVRDSYRQIKVPAEHYSETLNMFYTAFDRNSRENGNMLILTNKSIYRYNAMDDSSMEIKAPGINDEGQLSISLLDKRDSSLWVLKDYGKLMHYAFSGPDRMTLLGVHEVQPTESIWQEDNGTVCLLQPQSILRFNTIGDYTMIPVDDGLPSFWFCSQTTEGRTYFLSDNGVWVLGGEGLPRPLFNNGTRPSCFYEDEKGDYWIGLSGSGLLHYDNVSSMNYN